jgi:hypothetical protein
LIDEAVEIIADVIAKVPQDEKAIMAMLHEIK